MADRNTPDSRSRGFSRSNVPGESAEASTPQFEIRDPKSEIRDPEIACAYCDSSNIELMSLFGQSLLSSQYYCRNCHSVFEAVRWTEAADGLLDSFQTRTAQIPLCSATGTTPAPDAGAGVVGE